MANKSAEAPTTSVNPEALVFTGWTREGYWFNGQLLRGKEGRAVNITKYLAGKPYKAPEATQRQLADSNALASKPLPETSYTREALEAIKFRLGPDLYACWATL